MKASRPILLLFTYQRDPQFHYQLETECGLAWFGHISSSHTTRMSLPSIIDISFCFFFGILIILSSSIRDIVDMKEAGKFGELGKEFGKLGGRPKKGETPLAQKKSPTLLEIKNEHLDQKE